MPINDFIKEQICSARKTCHKQDENFQWLGVRSTNLRCLEWTDNKRKKIDGSVG
jgi:hypothetical protein